MKKTVTQSHVRSINQLAILEAIFSQGDISKAELSRILNMSKPSTADNVAQLLQTGIIREIGEGVSGGGRKPTLLRFCEDFKYLIVMDFHYQNSFFCLSDLKGTILNHCTIQQTPLADFNSWSATCVNAVAMLMAAQCITAKDLASIAVSVPGILSDDSSNYIVSPKYGDFNAMLIKEKLLAAFEVPILIQNSTNASALGEWRYGDGQACRHMAFVSCGIGVGSGLILNGKLHEGKRLAAGEIGFYITPDSIHSPLASLENRICIDSILSILSKDSPVTFREMIKRWEKNDSQVRELVDMIGIELGCAVCNLLCTIDCELVIIGGDYLAFENQLIPKINQIVMQYSPITVPVIASRLGEKASALGLIATSREHYFRQLCQASSGAGQ